jgi:2-oxoglutarate decarboxylase
MTTTLDAQEHQTYIAQTLQVHRLVSAFRFRGHLVADLDPLKMENKGTELAPDLAQLVQGYPHFDLEAFKMGDIPVDRKFLIPDISGNEFEEPGSDDWWTLQAVLEHLHACYASTTAFEISHIPELKQRQWIQRKVENKQRHKRKILVEEQRQILQVRVIIFVAAKSVVISPCSPPSHITNIACSGWSRPRPSRHSSASIFQRRKGLA